ncbi:5663_t:CDS:2 [Acaulospora morrowiae]|uniref:5663_t:CDS:1 n=1 Tax=Acaulospora morrowiae TaxID=94023 RepID=A0A9N9EW85_9GLOM|nr:5663_t:CDS:2 [Acaulospora morrowiae]
MACCYEFEMKDLYSINSVKYSPPFATAPDTFWQLEYNPISTSNPDYCSFYLVSICKKKQNIDSKWNKCLPAKIYFKRSDGKIYREFDVLRMDSIVEGIDNFCRRISLHLVNVIGVKFNHTRFVENCTEPPFPSKPIPDNLILAWSSELNKPDKANVKLNVQGQTIYASSTILAKRSEYFQRIFEGEWAECKRDIDFPTVAEDLTPSSTKLPTLQPYKYEINITDFKYRTLYGIADKYLLTDLQDEIKSMLILKTNRKNAAEMLFKHAWKWEELKAIMMPYVVENFEEIRKTKGFKDIVKNKLDYSMYHELNTEILMSLYPAQDSDCDESISSI